MLKRVILRLGVTKQITIRKRPVDPKNCAISSMRLHRAPIGRQNACAYVFVMAQ
jgi:hypothetical protein